MLVFRSIVARLSEPASPSPSPLLPSLARRLRLGALLGGLAALAPPAAAQGPFHVSTTSDQSTAGLAIDDASLVVAAHSGGPRPFFFEGHWQAVAGFVPVDVDGFGRRPGFPSGSASSMAFSIQSNEGGILDGDVFSFAPGGGFEVVVSEAELLDVLGVPLANIDVDAVDFDLAGCLYFSLQNDLAGTVLGDIRDGDVLCYDPVWGTIIVKLSEADVQAAYTFATGSVAAIGDVIALDHQLGEIWVVVQSPSSWDGAVIGCGGAPWVVMDEIDMGLGGAEIDALSVADPGDRIPTIQLDPLAAAPGTGVTVSLWGDPGTTYVALMSGGTGWIDFSRRPGFGAFYFDPLDPWLNTFLGKPGPMYGVTDASGRLSVPWTIPPAGVWGTGVGGEEGWSFQVLELPTFELSAPFRVSKL